MGRGYVATRQAGVMPAGLAGTFPRLAVITPQMVAAETSDPDLMRRTAAGDREAFAAIYRRHHATVYRFARLMTGSTSIAEDVVQEVFLYLMKDAWRYDPAQASLSTYLYGIARHRTRRALLRARRFVSFTDDDGGVETCGTDAASDLARRSDVRRLRCAILALPPRYREVIVLCELHGLSYAEASGALGCALGTIRSRLHRAKQLLAAKMRHAATSVDRPRRPTVRCPV